MSLNSLEEKDLFEFGPFRLDLRARLLSRNLEEVALAPKSFDVLAYLVRHAGRAVSREELLGAVWPDVVVSDGSLTQTVFVLRRALGESEDGPVFLATVPRVGYRFSPEVRAMPRDEAPAPPAPAAVVRSAPDAAEAGARRRVATGAASLALLALAVAAVRWVSGPRMSNTEPLLALVREIAAPPDSASVLGTVNGSAVLASPSAIALLPLDGAQSATRVALGAGEVPANRLLGFELVLVSGRDVAARDALTGKTRSLGRLPDDAPAARAGRVLVSPSGRFLALRAPDVLVAYDLAGGAPRAVARFDAPETENEAFALSDRWIAFAGGDGAPLRARDLTGAHPALEAPLPETRVKALAIDVASERIAAGGASDVVHVFRTSDAARETFPVRGWTQSLVWIGDHPTLVAAGRLGLTVWRSGAGVVFASPAPANGGPSVETPDGILVLAPDRQRLALVSYAGFAPEVRVRLSTAPLWALASDADGRTLFSGGRDGVLYALDVATKGRSVRQERVHTDGIPSLLSAGGLLASSSDDKTVAIWKPPLPKLVARTRAHDFLVNDLQLAPDAPGGPLLVTSSSDGTVKTWRWPSLEPVETVDLAAFAGEKVEAHALWTSPDAARVLVGTWSHSLLDLVRSAGGWTGRKLDVDGGAVYRLAGLPSLGLVAGVGILPHEVFLFDLASGERRRLEGAGLDAEWCVATARGDGFDVVGSGGVNTYTLAPAADGAFAVSLVARRRSGLALQTAARLPSGALWAGTQDGFLVALPLAAPDGPVLSRETVQFPRK